MDQRSAFPPCAQLLHAAAWTGSSTTGHLCRLASAQDVGRHCCGRSFCYSVDLHYVGAQFYLCDPVKFAVGLSQLLIVKSSGAEDKCRIIDTDREPGPEKRSDVDFGG